MRSMVAQLSPHEENTLRRVGFGIAEEGVTSHLRRLLQLELVEWSGWTWQLTPAGRARYGLLVQASDALRRVA